MTLATCSSRLSPVVCSSAVRIVQCAVCTVLYAVWSEHCSVWCVKCEGCNVKGEVCSVHQCKAEKLKRELLNWATEAFTALSSVIVHSTAQCAHGSFVQLYCIVLNNYTMCKLLICTTVLHSTSQLHTVQMADMRKCNVLYFTTSQRVHSWFVQMYCSSLHSCTMCKWLIFTQLHPHNCEVCLSSFRLDFTLLYLMYFTLIYCIVLICSLLYSILPQYFCKELLYCTNYLH